MAFRFGMESLDVPVEDQTGSFTVDFPLGYDLEQDIAVLMSVMFVRGDSYLEGKFEKVFDLQFGIRILNVVSGKVSVPDFTIETGRQFIPAHATGQVLTAIKEAIDILIRQVSPQFITMETFYGSLPEKALTKYAVISSFLIDSGYTLADRFRDGTTGIDYWFFRQNKLF